MTTTDKLIGGMTRPDWRVRPDAVDRLLARAGDDDRTIPTLIATIEDNPCWQVVEVL